jgi:hypothetical protein
MKQCPKSPGCPRRAPSSPASDRFRRAARPAHRAGHGRAGIHRRSPGSLPRRSPPGHTRPPAGRPCPPGRGCSGVALIRPASGCMSVAPGGLGSCPCESGRVGPLASLRGFPRTPATSRHRSLAHVMQQRGEPHTLTLSRRLAHGYQSIRRGTPALRPDRGCLTAVPLGRGPSLHGLRRGQALIVRPLLRYCNPVRLLIRVRVHRSAVAFLNRPGMPVRARMRSPRFRAKDVSTCMGSPTARGPSPASQLRRGGCCLLFSGTRSAPRNSTRFAAQYPARGLPCERFTSALAGRRASLGAGAVG